MVALSISSEVIEVNALSMRPNSAGSRQEWMFWNRAQRT